MNTDPFQPAGESPVDPEASIQSQPVGTPPILQKRTNRATAVAGTILVGGGALVALLGPLSASAASPSPDPSAAAGSSGAAAPAASSGTTEAAEPAEPAESAGGGHIEAVSDTSIAATAIGITETDLLTALRSGKTIAAVATAKNIDPQKVIDALTQDGLDELAAQVTAGTLTQAQADAQKANVTQRASDQVNGTFKGGGRGHNEANEAPEASPVATSGG